MNRIRFLNELRWNTKKLLTVKRRYRVRIAKSGSENFKEKLRKLVKDIGKVLNNIDDYTIRNHNNS